MPWEAGSRTALSCRARRAGCRSARRGRAREAGGRDAPTSPFSGEPRYGSRYGASRRQKSHLLLPSPSLLPLPIRLRACVLLLPVLTAAAHHGRAAPVQHAGPVGGSTMERDEQ